MASTPPSRRPLLEAAFRAAVAAADPAGLSEAVWPAPPAGRLVIAAFGKAADGMACAAQAHYGARALEGVVVVPRGARPDGPTAALPRLEAGHPVPDEGSFEAGERLLALAAELGPDDLLLVLLSGGASALACAPAGLTREEARELHRALLRSGADIADMNAVRRALSRLKGGRLAAAAHPAPTVTLAISDVVGDALADIGSGPTVGDPTEPSEALRVLREFDVAAPAALAAVERAAAGTTPAGAARVGPGDPRLVRSEARVVASGGASLRAAARVLEEAGWRAVVLAGGLRGDAREAGGFHAAVVAEVLANGEPWPPPLALLSGGETTVRVRGEGRGGRNSTLALAFALALPADAPVHALVADSDGIDGVGGHAGAFVEPGLVARLGRADARAYLAADDSYAAFARAEALFAPGPTGTNVNDVRIVLIDPPRQVA